MMSSLKTGNETKDVFLLIQFAKLEFVQSLVTCS